ncbi:hypothetical protein [Streptomyces sp. NPDC051162]
MTVLAWLWPVQAALAALGLITYARRAPGPYVLPALVAVAIVSAVALITQ